MHDLVVCRPCGAIHEADGHDTPSNGALCHACAAATISSGSRFAPLFCATCLPDVREHNAHATTPIPVGRHSLVNGVGLNRDTLRDPDAIENFVRAVRGLGDDIDGVTSYARDVVRRNLDVMGAEDTVPLARYLEAVEPATVHDLVATAGYGAGLTGEEER